MSKKKKPQKKAPPKCGATEGLTVAVTRPEKDEKDGHGYEMYGVDLEGDRRRMLAWMAYRKQ